MDSGSARRFRRLSLAVLGLGFSGAEFRRVAGFGMVGTWACFFGIQSANLPEEDSELALAIGPYSKDLTIKDTILRVPIGVSTMFGFGVQ